MSVATWMFHQKSDVAPVAATPASTPEPQKETIPMSTAPVTPEVLPPAAPAVPGGGPVPPVHPGGFKSFLQHVGSIGHKVLAFLGSKQNQQVILRVEETAAAAVSIAKPELAPAVQAGLGIAETLTKHIFAAEALGASAVNQDPNLTNMQKAAAVVAAAGPEAIQAAKDAGLTVDVKAANDAMVAYWQAFGASAELIAALKAPATPAA